MEDVGFGLAFPISLYGSASKTQIMSSSYRAEHGGLAASLSGI